MRRVRVVPADRPRRARRRARDRTRRDRRDQDRADPRRGGACRLPALRRAPARGRDRRCRADRPERAGRAAEDPRRASQRHDVRAGHERAGDAAADDPVPVPAAAFRPALARRGRRRADAVARGLDPRCAHRRRAVGRQRRPGARGGDGRVRGGARGRARAARDSRGRSAAGAAHRRRRGSARRGAGQGGPRRAGPKPAGARDRLS